jgi:hypothetical protein
VRASHAAGRFPTSLCAADLDGDGRIDLAASNEPSTLSVLMAGGHGAFAESVQYRAAGPQLQHIVALRANLDLRLDLAVMSATASNPTLFSGRCR